MTDLQDATQNIVCGNALLLRAASPKGGDAYGRTDGHRGLRDILSRVVYDRFDEEVANGRREREPRAYT